MKKTAGSMAMSLFCAAVRPVCIAVPGRGRGLGEKSHERQ